MDARGLLQKQPWGERSRESKLLTAILIAAALALVTAAERDIQRRTNEEIRGSKLLWRIVSLNALGAAAYFRRGRVVTR